MGRPEPFAYTRGGATARDVYVGNVVVTESEWLTSTDPRRMLNEIPLSVFGEWFSRTIRAIAEVVPMRIETDWDGVLSLHYEADAMTEKEWLECQDTRLLLGELLRRQLLLKYAAKLRDECVTRVAIPRHDQEEHLAAFPDGLLAGAADAYVVDRRADENEEGNAVNLGDLTPDCVRDVVPNPFRETPPNVRPNKVIARGGAEFDVGGKRTKGPATVSVPTPEDWLLWNDGTVQRIARRIYDDCRFSEASVLGDALIDSGCPHQILVDHFAGSCPHCGGSGKIATGGIVGGKEINCHHCKDKPPPRHWRNCWGLALILGK